MKGQWILATMICTAATVAAQDRNTGVAREGNGQTVTMTGCVTREDMSFASGRKSVDGRAVTSGGDADKFLLSDARVVRPGQEKTVGTSGTATSNTDPVSVAGAHYLLVGQSADFRPHLGHQVEVTGRIGAMKDSKGSGPMVTEQKNERPGTDANSTAASREAGGAASAAFSGPQIQVDSIKMITASCEIKK
jgi:hypothetical protein